MANGTINFFASSQAISLSGWTLQTEENKSFEYAYHNELGANGNEIASTTVPGAIRTSWMYVHDGTSGNLTIPNAGAVIGSSSTLWHVDELRITWNREQMRPKLTVSGHRHMGGGTHAAGSCRQYAASITVATTTFGVPANLGAVTLAQGAAVDFRSATYTLRCNHEDETGKNGRWLAGDNYDGAETLEVEFTGSATTDDYSITTGWSLTGQNSSAPNTGVSTTSLTLTHHVSHVTASANLMGSATPPSGDGETGDGEG